MQIRKTHILTTIVALALAGFLLSRIDLREISDAFRRLSPVDLVIAFSIYLGFNYLKGLRFSLLLRNLAPNRLLPVMLIYSFWSNLLPMRTGDLTYLYMLRSRNGVSVVSGVSSLVVGSVVDIIINMMLLATIGGYFLTDIGARNNYAVVLMSFLISVAVLLLIYSLLRAKRDSIAKDRNMFLSLDDERMRSSSKLICKLIEVARELSSLRPSLLFAKVLPVSMVSIVLRYALQCYLVYRMGFGFGWLKTVFALAFAGFFNMFPIQGIAGVGTTEAPWSWALIEIGVETSQAIASGFSLHAIIIGFAILSGGIGFAVRWRQKIGTDQVD